MQHTLKHGWLKTRRLCTKEIGKMYPFYTRFLNSSGETRTAPNIHHQRNNQTEINRTMGGFDRSLFSIWGLSALETWRLPTLFKERWRAI